MYLLFYLPLILSPLTESINIGKQSEPITAQYYPPNTTTYSEGMLVGIEDWFVIASTLEATGDRCKGVVGKAISICKEELDALNKDCKKYSVDQQAIIDAISIDNVKLEKELKKYKKSDKIMTYVAIGASIFATGMTTYLVIQ